jgi:hypothetical protein
MDTIQNYRHKIPDDHFLLAFDREVKLSPVNLIEKITDWLCLQTKPQENAEALNIRIHESKNNVVFSAAELEGVKRLFWSKFSDCYNKMEKEHYHIVSEWRDSAEKFMNRLCSA